MFPVTITVHNNAQLNAVLAAMNIGAPASYASLSGDATAKTAVPKSTEKAATKQAKTETDKEQTESPKGDAAQSSEPTQTASDSSESSSTESNGNEPSDLSYQQVADLVMKVSRTKGRDAAIGIFKQFGVGKLPEAKPEQYADIYKACEEALA